MKVALLGAPGAGKSEIAKRLARNLNRDDKGRWSVIDNYVESLTERTGCEYGEKGWYTHNAQVMVERWTREAEAVHRGHHTITCGTIYETIIYAALINLVPPTDEGELLRAMQEAEAAMRFFGLMEQHTMNYNALFRIPFPEQDFELRNWDAVIDAKLPDLVDGYGRYAIELAEPTLRAKTKHALEVIRHFRDSYLAEDEQQAV